MSTGATIPTLLPFPTSAPLINYTALARINPPEGVASVQRDITLDPGLTFTCTLHGQDGQPLVGAGLSACRTASGYHEAMNTV